MLFDIIRFNTFALDVLEKESALAGAGRQETLGTYLNREGYSQAFKYDYLIPMTAAVWSTSPDKCALDFPVVTLIRFMCGIFSSKPWREANREEKVELSSSEYCISETAMAHDQRRCKELR